MSPETLSPLANQTTEEFRELQSASCESTSESCHACFANAAGCKVNVFVTPFFYYG